MEYDENVIAMVTHGRKSALKVYVACSSREIERAERAMDEIRRRGGIITFDWTVDVRQWGSKAPDETIGLRCAMSDLGGVRDADVVLVLDGEFSYGRTIEHGAALALGKILVVSGPTHGRIWETLEHARMDVQGAPEEGDLAAIGAVFVLGGAVARHELSPSPVRFECSNEGERSLITGVDICSGETIMESVTLPASEG